MEMGDKSEKIILGIDPGTNVMGYGVLRIVGRKAEMLSMGVIDLRKMSDPYLRLGHIYERVTGITTMQMDAGLDTGDMLLRREVPIHADTTYGSLHDALMETGASLLVETLEQLAAGTLVRTPQTGESSYAARITRETAVIDWSKSARALDALVRGLNPTPYAQTSLDGAVYKIGGLRRTGRAASAPAGTLVSADRRAGLCIAAGDEDVEITEIQAPGKKMMAASAFLNGCALAVGTRFSS